MDAILQLLGAVAAFILYASYHALEFLYFLIRAAISKDYRHRLRKEWNNSSSGQQTAMIIGTAMYSAAFIFALCFWGAVAFDKIFGKDELSNYEQIELSADEIKQLKETKEIKDLVNTAREIIKKKSEDPPSE